MGFVYAIMTFVLVAVALSVVYTYLRFNMVRMRSVAFAGRHYYLRLTRLYGVRSYGFPWISLRMAKHLLLMNLNKN